MSDTSSVSATSIRLPDYPTQWPVRARNPHATEELIDETRAWLKTFSAYDDNGINRFFKCKFEEVAALAYPTLNKAGLRAAIEFMYMVFVIDEHTDEKDAESVKRQCEDIVKIMENSDDPSLESSVVGKMMKEYWTRLTSVNGMSSSTQRRFREHFTKYVKSMYPEALARDHHEYLSIADYMAARRDSVGGMTLLDNALIHSDLPDEVFEHPHIRKMLDYTIDIIIFTNDVYSFFVERLSADPYHNLVCVTMNELQLDEQDAIDAVAKNFSDLSAEFRILRDTLPDFGSEEIQRMVEEFVDGMAYFIEGHIEWSFLSERYFGTKGSEVKETGIVEL